MFRIAVTDSSGTFTWRGWFSNYAEAAANLPEAEDEFPDATCAVEELQEGSGEKSKWAEALDPEGE